MYKTGLKYTTCLLALLLVLSFSVRAEQARKPRNQTNNITMDVTEGDGEPSINILKLPKASELIKARRLEKRGSDRFQDSDKEEREKRDNADRPEDVSSFERDSRRGRDRDRDRDKDRDRDRDD